MFKTLRTSITATTIVSIVIVSTILLWIATNVFENVYRDTSRNELKALSENMSSDLILSLAGDIDPFSIANTLLELEQYGNVKFAAVLDSNKNLIEGYIGKALTRSNKQNQYSVESQYKDYVALPLGISESENETRAVKIIGE